MVIQRLDRSPPAWGKSTSRWTSLNLAALESILTWHLDSYLSESSRYAQSISCTWKIHWICIRWPESESAPRVTFSPRNTARTHYFCLVLLLEMYNIRNESALEKCSIASLAHKLMLCSEWVPSEWASDKNITIIHSPSVNIWRRQKLKQVHH